MIIDSVRSSDEILSMVIYSKSQFPFFSEVRFPKKRFIMTWAIGTYALFSRIPCFTETNREEVFFK